MRVIKTDFWGRVALGFCIVSICGCGSQPTPSLAPSGAASGYVLQQTASRNFVYRFPLGQTGSLTPVILNLPDDVGGSLAVDSEGQIYVAGSGPHGLEVEVFAAGAQGSAAPIRTVVLPSNTPGIYSIAVDAGGKLYIASQSSILVYPAGANGSVVPEQAISDPNIGNPYELAVDGAGNIYVNTMVINLLGGVLVYPAGSNGKVTATRVLTNANGLGGVAVDAQGDIYSYSGTTGTPALVEFANGASGAATPIKSITVSGLSGFNNFAYLHVDSVDNWYVIDNQAINETSDTTPHLLGFSANATVNAKPSIDITSAAWTSSGASLGVD